MPHPSHLGDRLGRIPAGGDEGAGHHGAGASHTAHAGDGHVGPLSSDGDLGEDGVHLRHVPGGGAVRHRPAPDREALSGGAFHDSGVTPAGKLLILDQERQVADARPDQRGDVAIQVAPVYPSGIPDGRTVLARQEGQPQPAGEAVAKVAADPVDAQRRIQRIGVRSN